MREWKFEPAKLGSFPVSQKPRRSSVLFHKSSLLFLIICVCGIGSSASFADDFFSKANALYDNGQYKEAVPFYRAAIDEGRYEPFAWFNLGNTLVQLQKNEVALVAYRRTVELLPDFVKAWGSSW